jgi:hypothetical protein
LAREHIAIVNMLAGTYGMWATPTSSFMHARLPRIDIAPVLILNFRKRSNAVPEPCRSLQVNFSCQKKLWITAASTAKTVAAR